MAKKRSKSTHPIKCEKCDHEFHDDEAMQYPGKVYVHKGKVMCEQCLTDMGIMPDTAEPYKLYFEALVKSGALRGGY